MEKVIFKTDAKVSQYSLNTQEHSFHLVDPSPWPIISAFSAFMLTVGGVLYMHGYTGGGFLVTFGFIMVLFMMCCWWRDIIREAVYEGQHTSSVQAGLRIGVLLFILSEVMFFFAFFWAFFHASINPTFAIGGVWPPFGLVALNPWGVPFFNTLLLLSSGASLTWTHHALLTNNFKEVEEGFLLTLALGLIFTAVQYWEYKHAPFTISDGVYGSTFYMATGFHGFHVIIGTIFIAVGYIRFLLKHFSLEHHFGFEAAAWYWHFVDVVWLFLFISIYWWGS